MKRKFTTVIRIFTLCYDFLDLNDIMRIFVNLLAILKILCHFQALSFSHPSKLVEQPYKMRVTRVDGSMDCKALRLFDGV